MMLSIVSLFYMIIIQKNSNEYQQHQAYDFQENSIRKKVAFFVDRFDLWCIYNFIACNYQIIDKTFFAYEVFQVFNNPCHIQKHPCQDSWYDLLHTCDILLFFCIHIDTFFDFCFELHFLPPNLHLHLHEICLQRFLIHLFLIKLDTFRFSFLTLLGTHLSRIKFKFKVVHKSIQQIICFSCHQL